MLKCASCNEKATHWCNGCKRKAYCGKSCQNNDWTQHIKTCIPFYVLIGGGKRTVEELEKEKEAASEYVNTFAKYSRTKRQMKQELDELYAKMSAAERAAYERGQVLAGSTLIPVYMKRLSEYEDTMDNFISQLDELFGNMSEEARQENRERHPCHNRDDIITQESLDKLPEDAKVTLYENNLKYCYDLDALLLWMRTSNKNPVTNRNFTAEQLDIIRSKKEERLVMVLWPRWRGINTVSGIMEMRQLEELMHNAYGVEDNILEAQKAQRLEKELALIYSTKRLNQLVERVPFLKEAFNFSLTAIKWELFDAQNLSGIEKLSDTSKDVLAIIDNKNIKPFLEKNPSVIRLLWQKFFQDEPFSGSLEVLRERILFDNIEFYIKFSQSMSQRVNIKRGESIRTAYSNAFKQHQFPKNVLPENFLPRWLAIMSHWHQDIYTTAITANEFELPWPGEPKIDNRTTQVHLYVKLNYDAPNLDVRFEKPARDILQLPQGPEINIEEIARSSPTEFAQRRQNYWFRGLENLSDPSMFVLFIHYFPYDRLKDYDRKNQLQDFQQFFQLKDITQPPWERVAWDIKKLLDVPELADKNDRPRNWIIEIVIQINMDILYQQGISYAAKNWTTYYEKMGFTYSGFRWSREERDYGTKYPGIDWARIPYKPSEAKDWVKLFPTINHFSIAVKTSKILNNLFWSNPFNYSDKPEFWSVLFKKFDKVAFEKALRAKYYLQVNEFVAEVTLGPDENWQTAYELVFKQMRYVDTLKIPDKFVITDWIMSSSFWDVNEESTWGEERQSSDLPWPNQGEDEDEDEEQGPLANEETGDYTLVVNLDYRPLQVKIKFSIPDVFKPYFFNQDASPKMYIDVHEFMVDFQDEDEFQAKHAKEWFSNMDKVKKMDKYKTRIQLVKPGYEDEDDNPEVKISDIREPPYKRIWELFNARINLDGYSTRTMIGQKTTILVIVEIPRKRYFIDYTNLTTNDSVNEEVIIQQGQSLRTAFETHFDGMDLFLPDHYDENFILISSKWRGGGDWDSNSMDLSLPWPRSSYYDDDDSNRYTLEVNVEYVPPNIEFVFNNPPNLEGVFIYPDLIITVEDLNQFSVEDLANRHRRDWIGGLQNIDPSLYQLRINYDGIENEGVDDLVIEDITQPPWLQVFDQIRDFISSNTEVGPWSSPEPADWTINMDIEPRE